MQNKKYVYTKMSMLSFKTGIRLHLTTNSVNKVILESYNIRYTFCIWVKTGSRCGVVDVYSSTNLVLASQ